MNILIVEDESAISESLTELLEMLGHSVNAVAATGEEALLALKKKLPDLLLLDIKLKGAMTGIDLAHIIKERYAVPFVFTTAFADDETITQAKEEGPFGYLVKPYSTHDIKAAIAIARSNFESMQEMQHQNSPITAGHEGFFFVKTEGKLVKIEEDNLLYIEARGDYMYFNTMAKNHLVQATLKAVEQKLNPQKFMKIHRSFIVNLAKIEDIDETTLVIQKNMLPVSRRYRANLLKRLNTI